MKTGRPSRTAFRVAERRAVHQLLDRPPVLNDPIAIPLLGREFAYDAEKESSRSARAFRAFMVARSRLAEDQLAAAAAQGLTQYVVLGAGLDTFAYRNPFGRIRVFEVDFPATQQWKRSLLTAASIPIPANLKFVPLDFEHRTLAEGLASAGFDSTLPAFFGWLGVVPYLSLPAFRSTLETIGRLPADSGVCFDFAQPPESIEPEYLPAFRVLAARVAAAGEPFRLFFTPQQLEQEFRAAGFTRIEIRTPGELNDIYFKGRADGFAMSGAGVGMFATAWT
ncbi:MAG: class I SAM-dependent methyltransferase [Terracidiphilus sp.]|jgi:methyltransferase (TIGR00027 family)